MEDIRTKSENTTPRQRAAAQIPKEAMRQLWLRSKEKGRTEIESTADGQQGGQYSEANQTGEKVSDALQSVGKSSAKVAVHKGRELAKKRAGQRHMEQSVERQEQTGQQSFSELQAPDGGQVSSNLTEPRECSVPSGKENPSANHSRMLQMLFRLYPIICLARNSGGADCPCPVLLCFFINHEHLPQGCPTRNLPEG